MMNEGIRLLKRGQYERALQHLLDAHVESPEYPELSYYLGLCYTHLGRHDEALLYLEQVVTSELSFTHVYQSRMILGYIYSVTGRFRLAEFEFRKLLDDGFDSARTHAALGYVLYEEDDLDAAIAELERALELDPDNSNALNSLGFILADTDRDPRRAVDYCRRAVRRQPKNPVYLDSLGWAYYKLGRTDEARDVLRSALEGAPGNREIAAHLREIMHGPSEARR
ncbi:MAG: tetratricopeptide repeat protein [Spirochaetota bacterium]